MTAALSPEKSEMLCLSHNNSLVNAFKAQKTLILAREHDFSVQLSEKHVK